MNKTYICISLTNYSDHRVISDAYYYRNDGIHPATYEKLTAEEANKLMWVLMGFGGKSLYYSNMFNSGISTRQVTFFGEL